jgi:hypothetical protein
MTLSDCYKCMLLSSADSNLTVPNSNVSVLQQLD